MSFAPPPASQPGPVVNGRPTKLHLLPSHQLASSPFFQGLYAMINVAYGADERPYISTSVPRLGEPTELLAELGEAGSSTVPGNFLGHSHASTYILTFAEPKASDPYEQGVIGTGSVKPSPYHSSSEQAPTDAGSEKQKTFTRPTPITHAKPGVVDWELKVLAVGPQYVKQGIAQLLLAKLDEEMRRRTAKADALRREHAVVNGDAQGRTGVTGASLMHGSDGANGVAEQDWDTVGVLLNQPEPEDKGRDIAGRKETSRKIRIMLTTIAEQNEKFYLGKNYVPVGRTYCKAGTLGGTLPFHIVHMDRMLE